MSRVDLLPLWDLPLVMRRVRHRKQETQVNRQPPLRAEVLLCPGVEDFR